MDDKQRLQTWMDQHGYTVWDMARELDVNRVWVYRMMRYSHHLSDGFKLRFIHRFGTTVAADVFDLPEVPDPSPIAQ